MSDQPYQGGQPYRGGPYEGYEGYEGYDPHQQQWPPRHDQHTPHDPYAGHGQQQSGYDPQLTQHWQGQTWDSQTHASLQMPAQSAEETAYLPPQTYEGQQYQQQPYQQ